MPDTENKWWNDDKFHKVYAGAEFADVYDMPAIVEEAKKIGFNEGLDKAGVIARLTMLSVSNAPEDGVIPEFNRGARWACERIIGDLANHPRTDPDPVTGFGHRLRIAGEPYNSQSPFKAAGEDLVNDRLLVTLLDWANAVNDGWKTNLDLTHDELTKVYEGLKTYLMR